MGYTLRGGLSSASRCRKKFTAECRDQLIKQTSAVIIFVSETLHGIGSQPLSQGE
jgi:hypothetical protein